MSASPLPISEERIPSLNKRVNNPLKFDRRKLRTTIASIGGSSVLFRALFVPRIDELNLDGANLGITSISCGTEPHSVTKAKRFAEQNGLFVLHEHDGVVDSTSLIGSITEVLLATDQPNDVLDLLADPVIELVTLSITKEGYEINDRVLKDLIHSSAPETALGYVFQGLRLRRSLGYPPPVFLSLENMEDNGHVLKKALIKLAEIADPDLIEYLKPYLDTHFPRTMVDKICPTSPTGILRNEQAYLMKQGIVDGMAVAAEPYGSLVIEDTSPWLRDLFNKSKTVSLVPSERMRDYEIAKLRGLNALHRAIGYAGLLAGYEYVHEAVGDPYVRNFIRKLGEEVALTFPQDPAIHLTFGVDTVLNRFSNSANPDPLTRLVNHSTAKLGERVVAPMRELLERGEDTPFTALTLALWFKMLRGKDDKENDIDFSDNLAKEADLPAKVTALFSPTHPIDFSSVARFLQTPVLRGLLNGLETNPIFIDQMERAIHLVRQHPDTLNLLGEMLQQQIPIDIHPLELTHHPSLPPPPISQTQHTSTHPITNGNEQHPMTSKLAVSA